MILGLNDPITLIKNILAQLTTIVGRNKSGTGSPEGVVEATPGTTYVDTNGGVGTTFYVKETGTGNTGWAAK